MPAQPIFFLQIFFDGILTGVVYNEMGQADKTKERLQSHLDNAAYRSMKIRNKEGVWDRCMRMDEKDNANGGINIFEPSNTYSAYKWAVVVFPLKGSTSAMRELVEWAFDNEFERPIGSCKERKSQSETLKAAVGKLRN